jgi:phosphoribosylaminoimidazole carboxylase
MPLGDPRMKVGAAVMVNILGDERGLEETLTPCKESLSLPGATVHLYGKKGVPKKGRKMGHITIVGEGMPQVLHQVRTLVPSETLLPESRPLVGLIMGSDSDLPILEPAAQILQKFQVPFELTIVSAHRTPDRMVEYAKTAHSRGLQVIIAGAGGAAHLPGMVAALSPLPVIGVPVALKFLDGVDSLHSIVQMPRGVPVATVAINNATNAALLAIRILGCAAPFYQDQLVEYASDQEKIVMEKVEKLQKTGWKSYP